MSKIYFDNRLVYTVARFKETDKIIFSLLEIIEQQGQILDGLSRIIGQQEERISDLSRIVYELAPEYEVIETMAETEEERAAMVEAYMNHGNI